MASRIFDTVLVDAIIVNCCVYVPWCEEIQIIGYKKSS